MDVSYYRGNEDMIVHPCQYEYRSVVLVGYENTIAHILKVLQVGDQGREQAEAVVWAANDIQELVHRL